MSSTIFFTADTHFMHDNIIEYSKRPFTSIADMTDAIITNWNAMVGPGDIVYHLGDFALTYGKRDVQAVDDLLKRLNGNKWLIKGNHDRDAVTKNPRWTMVKDYHELKIDMGGVHRQRIVLFHYCLKTWDQQHRGSFMLHGHSHGGLSDIGGKVMDVGVDCNNYKPVSIDDVVEFMKHRDVATRDHHKPRAIYLGDKFGEWEVIGERVSEIAGDTKPRKLHYRPCMCQCSRVKNVREDYLLNDQSRMCVQCATELKRSHGRVVPSSYMRTLKHNAGMRGLSMEISVEDICALLELQDYKCALSGVDIWFAESEWSHSRGGSNASVDRIDSNIGYEKDNVQMVHKHVNVMKRSLSDEEFVSFCRLIVKNADMKRGSV